MVDEVITKQELIDAQKDAQSLDDFINGGDEQIVVTRLLKEYPTLANAIRQIYEKGGKFYPTLAEASADIANIRTDVYVITGDNGAYYKATAGATSLTKSPYDPLMQAKVYADANAVFKPVLNPTEKNLNNLSYGVYYYSFAADITLANNFPVTAPSSYVLTYSVAGSSVKYQRAILPFSNPVRIFDRSYTGTWSTWSENTNKSTVDALSTKQQNFEDTVIYYDSFNKIDPSKVDFTKRYSTASKSFITDGLLIAASDYIPVIEGEWYTVSGTAIYGLPNSTACQGGYFTSDTATTAVDNISFVAPVIGTGAAFKVPSGLGITHVVISLDKTAGNVLDGTAQMEVGEMPTTYQPYNEVPRIKDSLLPNNSSSGSVAFDNATWYEYVNADGAKIFQDKLPKFRKAMLLKNEDVVVVNTGTSLTARTSEHCTLRTDAALRPPMMHSNAFCSLMWDAMKWEGQQYRRYDSAYFTETGTFATSSNLAEWDDGAYRDGLTRYSSDAAASVQFTIPINAWAFNFIYRTDSLGCDARITVAEGAGKVQVFDDATQTWIEAHNYTFSQLEATPVTRSVVIPSTVSSSTQTVTCASKGNTTYQKRLKMRCRGDNSSFDSLATAKTVTIARVGGGARFMYWGVEWSPRQYMITYINAARGSHNTSATGALGLPRFQDNEIWSFKPTLILSELGIHNDGAAAAGVYPVGHWQGLTYNYVNNTDFELSMFSRAAHFNNTTVEYAFFTASIAWNFSGINDDGSLKYGLQSSSEKGPARMMSALDKYQEATEYLNSVGIPCVDAAKRWVEAGVLIFGDLKTATLGSGKGGATFTNEGSHWNDTGGKIMAKAVIPII